MSKHDTKVPTRMRTEKEMSDGENDDLNDFNCNDDAMNRSKVSPQVIQPHFIIFTSFMWHVIS